MKYEKFFLILRREKESVSFLNKMILMCPIITSERVLHNRPNGMTADTSHLFGLYF